MRCDPKDPQYQVTFDVRAVRESMFKQYEKKRVGRPRGHWAETTMKEIMKEYFDTEFERDNTDHYIMLFSIALERLA